jgi:hypothetical protein
VGMLCFAIATRSTMAVTNALSICHPVSPRSLPGSAAINIVGIVIRAFWASGRHGGDASCLASYHSDVARAHLIAGQGSCGLIEQC